MLMYLFNIEGGGRRSLLARSRLARRVTVSSFFAVLALFVLASADSDVRVLNAQGPSGGICGRTDQIQIGIQANLADASHTVNGSAVPLQGCQIYTPENIANLKVMRRVRQPALTSLKSGDFAGMTGLMTLDIQNNEISELPADIFDGLDAVTDLRFGGNNIEDLPSGVFSGLPALRILVGNDNRLTHFKAGWFDGFQGFTSGTARLEFAGNQISTIDSDALDGMTALYRFDFSYNQIRSLPAELFDGLSWMRFVSLHFNDLETLPAGLFDRMTSDGSVGDNTTLTQVNVSDNNLRSLPSGIFDKVKRLSQARLHNNSLTSLPSGLFDNNAELYGVRLFNNQLASLPQGLFDNNPILLNLHLNDNRITSLDGVGLDNKGELLNFYVNNNALTQFPDAFVTNFIDDTIELSPNNCIGSFAFDNNPLSESWIQSGKLSDILTAFGRRTGGCEATELVSHDKFARRLGVGGIDLDVEVTGRGKTAWQLLLDDFAAADRYHAVNRFSFGWDGQEVDGAVIGALPTTLEEIKIQDSRFDSSVTGASFARFTKRGGVISQYNFRRLYDPLLRIDSGGLRGLPGLQMLRLDNVGLTGNASGILTGLPDSTMRLLAVTNNPDFNQIPAGVKSLTNLVGLDLKSNGLASLDANALQGLSSLLFLSVEDNDITTLHEDSFNGLRALRTLLMDDNDIATLPGDLFSGLRALRNVHLNDNELLGLPSGLFSGVSTLKTIDLQSNPGSPFQIGVSVVDDAADATMKQLHVREGAPYNFVAKVVKDGAVSSVVPVDAGSTMTTDAFTMPEGSEVELPTALRGERTSPSWGGGGTSRFQLCLGLEECFSGFEFVLDPKPSIVSMRFDNPNQQFTAGDKLRFKIQLDRDVVVKGKPQFSFMLGDETRYAVYVETTPSGMLCFEYTLLETDRAPDRVSLESSMLRYPPGSSIEDSTTGTVAATSLTYTYDTSRAPISRIEPTIRSVTVSAGDLIRIGVDVYGAQDIKDNGLADGIGFLWSDGDGGGEFNGNGREVIYAAPELPGTYTISVSPAFWACRAPATDEIRCEAKFEITVRRASAAVEPTPEPRNPEGEIPTVLADSEGEQYQVFTPEGGGTFTGDASSLEAGPGAVPNGEIIGLRIAEGDAATNTGKTHQRYSLGGRMYGVHVVDGSGEMVSEYVLDTPARVCVPLPDALRSNISDLALVAINSDDSLMILAAQVRISTAGTTVCGNLSNLPASVAVGSAGAPAALPTATPELAPEIPDTGGTAPTSNFAFWALLLGTAAVAVVTFIAIGRRYRHRAATSPGRP